MWDPSAHPSAHAHNLRRAGKLWHVLRCLSVPQPACLRQLRPEPFPHGSLPAGPLFAQTAEALHKSLPEIDRAARALQTDARLRSSDFQAFVRGLGASADVGDHKWERRALLRDGGEEYLYNDAIPFERGGRQANGLMHLHCASTNGSNSPLST